MGIASGSFGSLIVAVKVISTVLSRLGGAGDDLWVRYA